MTRRFPKLLSHLTLTLAIASGCTPGAMTLVPSGPGANSAGAGQPVMASDTAIAQNVSVGDARPIAGVAKLQASPSVKTSVTEMTQSLQEFLAFDADSTAVGDTFAVQGFSVAAKGGNSDDQDHGNLAKGKGKGKAPAPLSGPTCVFASDVGTVLASDATASDVVPAPRVAPSCPPLTNEKTKTTVINPDGSRTRTMTRTRVLPGGGGMTETMTRTSGKAPKFMSFQHVRDMTLPNGAKRHQERNETKNADGSGSTTVTMSFTRTDGKTRSLTMTTTCNADGTKTRTGTLTRFDGTTVSIASKGSQVTLTDPTTGTTVTTGETPTGTTGTVVVTVGGTPVGTVDTTTPGGTSPSPSPSPSASAAPTATPSAAATATPTAGPAATSSPAAAAVV